ncbi:hypothetical protein M513_13181 [Trichuris suis]|uniref:Uncharacterized protein n=1 Tax=Trichuris suis TaxID=68888 RepID=A0A085LLU7_9BILA|nr:hypothetical protein M513_13181 [Trichuris suis]
MMSRKGGCLGVGTKFSPSSSIVFSLSLKAEELGDYWSEGNAWFVHFSKAIELRGSIIRYEPKAHASQRRFPKPFGHTWNVTSCFLLHRAYGKLAMH